MTTTLQYSEAEHLSSMGGQQPVNPLPGASLRSDIARWLKDALGERNIASVAKEAGVSRTTVYSILNQETIADDDTVRKLAKALGVPPPRVGATSAWGAVLEVLERLPKHVQRDVAVRAVRQGIEAQELYGRGLLRAMLSMCSSLDELGYSAMAREIRSELLKAMEADLKKGEGEPSL